LTTPIRAGAGRFVAQIPDGWQQGRGAYGGVALGLLTRAVMAAAGEELGLRSLAAALCAPVIVGEAELLVESLRTGSGTATLAARLVQAGELRAHATAVLGRPRTGEDLGWEPPRVAPPPWRELTPVDIGPPLAPTFTRQMELRPTSAPPFSGSRETQASGWLRARDPGPARDAAYLAALSDVWWPSFLMRLAAPRPIATVSYMLEIVGSMDGLDPDAPLYHEGTSPVARQGYAVELRSLRGEDGRLLAMNQQVLAIIR
jgi:acyl-CoA thioesterase